MNKIRPRIMGTELEWNLLFLQGDEEQQTWRSDVTGVVDKVIDQIPQDLILKKTMLRNGGRIYNDCNIVEYAIGEEDSIEGLVASEIAGEQLVFAAAQAFALEYGYDTAILRKRVEGLSGGLSGNVSGYHINLCSEARFAKDKQESLRLLGFWAATASLYTGAGKLQMITDGKNRGRQGFTIAQKSILSQSGFSRSKVLSKPLIALSTESHAASKYSRIEVTGLDQNTSPWAMRMAAGTGSLVLRAIEQGYADTIDLPLNSYTLASTSRSVAVNGINGVVSTDNNYTMPALDFQYQIAELASKTDHTDEEALILRDWFTVLDSLVDGKGLLLDQIGWVQRKQKLDDYAATHGLNIASHELLAFDRTLDTIGQGSVAQAMRESVWSAYTPAASMIEHRLTSPCPTTRAAQRVAVADDYKDTLLDINWSMLRVAIPGDPDRYATKNVLLEDPYGEIENIVAK